LVFVVAVPFPFAPQPEFHCRFEKKRGKCLRAKPEFLPILKSAVEFREPAVAGGNSWQGARVPFSAYSFVA